MSEDFDLSRGLTAQELHKLEVETDNLVQDALLRKEKSESEIQKTKAEARKFIAEAERAEAETRIAILDAQEAEQAHHWEQAKDKYHRVYRYWSPVTEKSVTKCMERLNVWRRTDPACDITLIISSPGGSCIDGFALWDFVTELKDDGHHITTFAQGYAASMGGILLQMGDVRIMGKEAYMLIHPISAWAVGTLGQIEDEVKFLKRMDERTNNIFAERMAASTKRSFESAKKLLVKNAERSDWWIDSDEALKLGLVDEVR